MGRITPKIAHSHWGSGHHLIHGSLGPPESAREPHLDRLSRFCSAHERDQQTYRYTDRETDNATPFVTLE